VHKPAAKTTEVSAISIVLWIPSFMIMWFFLEIQPDQDANEDKHPEIKKCVDKVF
jgi:hypothetical protein